MIDHRICAEHFLGSRFEVDLDGLPWPVCSRSLQCVEGCALCLVSILKAGLDKVAPDSCSALFVMVESMDDSSRSRLWKVRIRMLLVELVPTYLPTYLTCRSTYIFLRIGR